MTNKEIITQLQDIKCHCQEMYEAEIKNGDTSSNIWEKDVEALGMAIKTLEQTRWIPVSERLPRDSGYYLTTTMYDEVYCDYWEGECFDRTEAVIAWMPLPQPYKAEREGEE